MLPDNLIFIQVVPQDFYFQWQIEVQIVNFRKFNVSDRMQILVWMRPNSDQVENWRIIMKKYPEVSFFFYEDEGVNLGLYISQLRPHCLKRHFKLYDSELKNKIFFYHDSDIIFRELPPFAVMCENDICYQSDTSSYLDWNYLVRKEEQGNIPDNEAIKEFARIGDISIDIIEKYKNNTGGAQSILKDIDYNFWEDVERMCLEIRKSFSYHIKDSINQRFFKSENEGFQSWCADMWALNFSLWKRDIVTQVTSFLDFSWATDSYETYLKKPIFHNAGADGQNPKIFYKGAYINKSPFNDPSLPCYDDMASSVYVKAIREV